MLLSSMNAVSQSQAADLKDNLSTINKVSNSARLADTGTESGTDGRDHCPLLSHHNNFTVGPFHCYDVEGLLRTNNNLEHDLAVVRVYEQRATGPMWSHFQHGSQRLCSLHRCCLAKAAAFLA